MNTERNNAKLKPLKMHLLEMTSLLVKIKRIRINVPNNCYNNLLDKSLIASIKKCEKDELSIHEMEYPIFESSMIHGFMGLKSYMLSLFYENSFCNEYDEEELLWLYTEYCKKNELDEKYSKFNIYTPVYLNALFCDYLKKDYGTLKLTKQDCELARKLLEKQSDSECESILLSAARHLTHGNLAYNNKTLIKLMPSIQSAIKRNNLDNLLIIENK